MSKSSVLWPCLTRCRASHLHLPAAGVRLQMALAPVRTQTPAGLDDRVADLAGRSLTLVELAVQDQATADAGPDPHAEQVPVGASGAPLPLAEDRDAHVVVEPDRHPAERLGDHGPERDGLGPPGTPGGSASSRPSRPRCRSPPGPPSRPPRGRSAAPRRRRGPSPTASPIAAATSFAPVSGVAGAMTAHHLLRAHRRGLDLRPTDVHADRDGAYVSSLRASRVEHSSGEAGSAFRQEYDRLNPRRSRLAASRGRSGDEPPG